MNRPKNRMSQAMTNYGMICQGDLHIIRYSDTGLKMCFCTADNFARAETTMKAEPIIDDMSPEAGHFEAHQELLRLLGEPLVSTRDDIRRGDWISLVKLALEYQIISNSNALEMFGPAPNGEW